MKNKTMIAGLILTLCTSVSAMAAPSGTVVCPSASTIQNAPFLFMSQLFSVNIVTYQLTPTQGIALLIPGALPTRAQARAVLKTVTASWTTNAIPTTESNGSTLYHCNYQPGAQHFTLPLNGNLVTWIDSPNAPVTKSAIVSDVLSR